MTSGRPWVSSLSISHHIPVWDVCLNGSVVFLLMSGLINLLWMCVLCFIASLKCVSYYLFVVVLFLLQAFEVNDLLQGLNFSKVLNSLVSLSKATEGKLHVITGHSGKKRWMWCTVYVVYNDRKLIKAGQWCWYFFISTLFTFVLMCTCRFRCLWRQCVCATLLNTEDQVVWFSQHSQPLL